MEAFFKEDTRGGPTRATSGAKASTHKQMPKPPRRGGFGENTLQGVRPKREMAAHFTVPSAALATPEPVFTKATTARLASFQEGSGVKEAGMVV